MANIVLTDSGNYIKIEYNGLGRDGICDVMYKPKSEVKMVSLCGVSNGKGSYVSVTFDLGDPWEFDMAENRGVKVDTVNAVAPSDNTDLAAKLAALI